MVNFFLWIYVYCDFLYQVNILSYYIKFHWILNGILLNIYIFKLIVFFGYLISHSNECKIFQHFFFQSYLYFKIEWSLNSINFNTLSYFPLFYFILFFKYRNAQFIFYSENFNVLLFLIFIFNCSHFFLFYYISFLICFLEVIMF